MEVSSAQIAAAFDFVEIVKGSIGDAQDFSREVDACRLCNLIPNLAEIAASHGSLLGLQYLMDQSNYLGSCLQHINDLEVASNADSIAVDHPSTLSPSVRKCHVHTSENVIGSSMAIQEYWRRAIVAAISQKRWKPMKMILESCGGLFLTKNFLDFLVSIEDHPNNHVAESLQFLHQFDRNVRATEEIIEFLSSDVETNGLHKGGIFERSLRRKLARMKLRNIIHERGNTSHGELSRVSYVNLPLLSLLRQYIETEKLIMSRPSESALDPPILAHLENRTQFKENFMFYTLKVRSLKELTITWKEVAVFSATDTRHPQVGICPRGGSNHHPSSCQPDTLKM